ncbi:MAG: hypothetical protein Q4D50_11705, partial [Eubacteriales bacterium]|nr:hypothetical protein [Eubacteriales bacterium]
MPNAHLRQIFPYYNQNPASKQRNFVNKNRHGAGGHEKTPSGKARREIFSEKSGQLVQLQCHAALLAGSVVLVQQTLDNSL